MKEGIIIATVKYAMLRLDPTARNVIGLHWSGQYQTQVVRQLNVHQSTMS